ncbi:MAG TPA: prepilin peptidase [Thermoanaerobaculia bacterium]|nr:prepilin peptidase [Thermoanaerobaculia bacterium]
MPPSWFLVLWAGALGLIVGSYLNVLAHRLPRGISTVTPRSRCPACGAAIRARDNLPVVSWLLLRGRCRDCGAPIPARYPLVEAVTGLAFAGAVARFGFGLEALVAAVLCALLVALAAIDVEHLLLPDRLTLPGIALGLGAQLVVSGGSLARGLAGALVGAGILLVLAGAWQLLRGVEGMGLGDVKMLAMIGAFLGLGGVMVTLVLGTLLGSVAGLALVARGRGTMQLQLPFGFFLAIGGLVAVFAGGPIVSAYLGLLR